jgi:formiminotetrahydrofolate cyclodeaminase
MTYQVLEQKLDEFLDTLASKSPTPGGGSVAAVTGAMAAGLVSMVCAIPLAKKKPIDDEEEIRSIYDQAEALRHMLQELAQADVDVFGHLSSAYKLPRTTEADAANRQAAIQKTTREAAEVPLKVARAAADLLPLCTSLVNRCSRLLVSDVGVAALLARSTVHTALLNVEVNISSLEDQLFVREVRAQMEDLTIGLAEETAGIVEIVQNRLHN